MAFRYAQSGNPRLAKAIAKYMNVAEEECIVTGNGSDEIIDLLIRLRCVAGEHNVLAFRPCFSMYKTQTLFAGVELRQVPLKADYTFDWEAFIADDKTTIAFVTTPAGIWLVSACRRA